jgi:hypothetical protein
LCFDYDPRVLVDELNPDLQDYKIKIVESDLFIQTLKEELTASKMEIKKADATIIELTKQLANLTYKQQENK